MELRFLDDTDMPLLDRFLRITNEPVQSWGFIKDSLVRHPDKIRVAAELDGYKNIRKLGVGYCLDLYGLGSNALPYWVAARARFAVKDARPIGLQIEEVMAPIGSSMEAKGLHSFFMCRLVPSSLDFTACHNYLTLAQARRNGITRYVSTLEELCADPSHVDDLPVVFRKMSYTSWPPHKKMAIIRHDLRPEFRRKDTP